MPGADLANWDNSICADIPLQLYFNKNSMFGDSKSACWNQINLLRAIYSSLCQHNQLVPKQGRKERKVVPCMLFNYLHACLNLKLQNFKIVGQHLYLYKC